MIAQLDGLELAAIIVVLALVMVCGRKLGALRRGICQGADEFIHEAKRIEAGLREQRHDLVAEALTPDNRTAEFLAIEPSSMKSELIVWLAQGFGVGRIRFAPGTWGSLVGIPWALVLLWPGSLPFFVVGILASSFVAVRVCGAAERILGEHDPGSVVLDEIVAVPVALGGYVGLWWWQAGELPSPAKLAHWWPAVVAAFVLFRLFDIWKPWPIRALQKLPGGWGVVADDLAAGAVSAVVLWLGSHGAFVVQLIGG